MLTATVGGRGLRRRDPKVYTCLCRPCPAGRGRRFYRIKVEKP